MKKEKFIRFHKIFTVVMLLLLLIVLMISFMLGTTRADTENQTASLEKEVFSQLDMKQSKTLQSRNIGVTPYSTSSFLRSEMKNNVTSTKPAEGQTKSGVYATYPDKLSLGMAWTICYDAKNATYIGINSFYDTHLFDYMLDFKVVREEGVANRGWMSYEAMTPPEFAHFFEQFPQVAGTEVEFTSTQFVNFDTTKEGVYIEVRSWNFPHTTFPPKPNWDSTGFLINIDYIRSTIATHPHINPVHISANSVYTNPNNVNNSQNIEHTWEVTGPNNYSETVAGNNINSLLIYGGAGKLAAGDYNVKLSGAGATVNGTPVPDDYNIGAETTFTVEYPPSPLDPISLNIHKPTEKIYHGITTPSSDTAKVEIKIPEAVFDDVSNEYLRDELTEAKYVIIPFDPTNVNFNDVPTRAQFQAAYTAAEDDQRGSFLQPGQTIVSEDFDQNLEYLVDVTDNCKVWVMIEEVSPTQTEDHFAVYTADNFYTPTQVYHKGLNVAPADADQLVYDAMSVGYEDANNDGIPDSYYGVPLDVYGNVIVSPSLGYDSVTVQALDSLPTSPIDLNKYWLWSAKTPDNVTQEKSLTLTFNQSYVDTHPNFADRTPSAENTHNFYYEKKPYTWIDIYYYGYIMPGRYSLSSDEFVMTPNPESVMAGVEMVRTPPVIDGYIAYAYVIDWLWGEMVDSEGGVATFTPVSQYEGSQVLFCYKEETTTLNVRQVLIDADEMIKPLSGYMRLYHIHEQTAEIKATIEIATTTGMRDIPYSKYLFPLSRFSDLYTQLKISSILPEYYTYIGHTLSYTSGLHNADDRIMGEPVVEFPSEKEAWVTIYITPTSKTLDFFNWDSAINDFGIISRGLPS